MVLNSGDIFLKGGFSYETILPLLKCLLSNGFIHLLQEFPNYFIKNFPSGGGEKHQRSFYNKIKIKLLLVLSLWYEFKEESGWYFPIHNYLHFIFDLLESAPQFYTIEGQICFFHNAVLHEITFSMTIGRFRCVQHFYARTVFFICLSG